MIRPSLVTVRVQNPDFAEGVLINKDDFRPQTDRLWKADSPEIPMKKSSNSDKRQDG